MTDRIAAGAHAPGLPCFSGPQIDVAPANGDAFAKMALGATDATQSTQQTTLDIASVLGRHEGAIKGKMDRKGLEKLRDAKDTPDDLKSAISQLLSDPAQMRAFDTAKNGKSDGHISVKDVRAIQDSSAAKGEASAKSSDYTHNYVPSDAGADAPAREMTENDAMREMFRYSQSMPKNIDMATLQKIADGSANIDKCPPQLAAAAQYFVAHPQEWQSFTKDAKDGKVSRDRMCDLASDQMKLSPQEKSALDTLQANKDVFFKGGSLTPDKLSKLADDESQPQDVRQAASLLSQDHSILFSMLDNGKHGAGGDAWNEANDKSIGKGDLSALLKKGTNEVEAAPVQSLATGLDGGVGQYDMQIGQQTAPDDKKRHGGEAKKALEILGQILTSFIPGVGEIGAAAGVAGRVIAAGVDAGESAARAGAAGARAGGRAFADSARDGAKGNAAAAARQQGENAYNNNQGGAQESTQTASTQTSATAEQV